MAINKNNNNSLYWRLTHLNYWAVFKMLLKMKSAGVKFLVYGKAQMECDKSSRITVKRLFSFGKNMFMSPSALIMKENSSLEVDRFVIGSGSNVFIGNGAKLKLGSGYIDRKAVIYRRRFCCRSWICRCERCSCVLFSGWRTSKNPKDRYRMVLKRGVKKNIWIERLWLYEIAQLD